MAPELESEREHEERAPRTARTTVAVLLIVAALFAGVVLAKSVIPEAGSGTPDGASLTAVHNDAVADYDAARESGRPIYILFHALS